jgi:di/tricarboxylate transporter
MSPVANAVNALAYGGVKNVSLKNMLRLGVFTDFVAVILTTLLATYILPLIYG